MLNSLSLIDAINLMLASIGSDPINEIDDTDADVSNALRICSYLQPK